MDKTLKYQACTGVAFKFLYEEKIFSGYYFYFFWLMGELVFRNFLVEGFLWSLINSTEGSPVLYSIYTPQPLRVVRVLFSPIVSGWAGGCFGGQWEKVCPGCILETIRCRK